MKIDRQRASDTLTYLSLCFIGAGIMGLCALLSVLVVDLAGVWPR